MRAAGLKRTIIEASGNGPVIVLADADLELAAQAAAYGAYWNAGQVCCATERVIVEAAVHDEFLTALDGAATAAVLGDPFAADTTLGPLNNEPTAAKMDRHVADAQERGASVRHRRWARVGLPDLALLRVHGARGGNRRHARRAGRVVRAGRAGAERAR